jgi:hypothetical protein
MGRQPQATAFFFTDSASARVSKQGKAAMFLLNHKDLKEGVKQNAAASKLQRQQNESIGTLTTQENLTPYLDITEYPAAANSPFGSIIAYPRGNLSEHVELARKVFTDLLLDKLCSCVYLAHGCERQIPIFGKWRTDAIIASPDFAKLTALYIRGNITKENKLVVASNIVPLLDDNAAPQKYCSSEWKKLIAESKRDARFLACWK